MSVIAEEQNLPSRVMSRVTNFTVIVLVCIATVVPGRVKAVQLQPADPTPARVADTIGCVCDPFSVGTLVRASELSTMRGGFMLAGLELEFGANLRTFIDGALVMDTVFTFTSTGPELSQQLTPLDQGQTPSSNPEITEVMGISRVDFDGLARTNNVVILEDHKGLTAVAHQLTQGGIVNVLVNQASGRLIRHEMDLNITVGNFTQFQHSMRAASIVNALSRVSLGD